MTENWTFEYVKCFSCSRVLQADELIEMNTNMVKINEQNIDFDDLLFETCSTKVSKSKHVENLIAMIT